MNMKENILFLMYAIRGNFDHVGGTSTSVSEELSAEHKMNTRNERKRLRKTSKLVGSSVFLERLNVNFFSINVEHLD